MTLLAAPGAHAVVARMPAPAAPLAAGIAGLGAVAYVAVVDPSEPGHYPTCPFLAVTGYNCPGCGSLRALHALTNGELATAADFNLLTVLAAAPVVVAWALWLRRERRGAPRRFALPAVAVWSLLALVLVFAVVRNLPFGAVLAA